MFNPHDSPVRLMLFYSHSAEKETKPERSSKLVSGRAGIGTSPEVRVPITTLHYAVGPELLEIPVVPIFMLLHAVFREGFWKR